jgi:hypothetical protein
VQYEADEKAGDSQGLRPLKMPIWITGCGQIFPKGSFMANNERKTPRSRSFQANTDKRWWDRRKEKKSEAQAQNS